jgi:hypothetical protein
VPPTSIEEHFVLIIFSILETLLAFLKRKIIIKDCKMKPREQSTKILGPFSSTKVYDFKMI